MKTFVDEDPMLAGIACVEGTGACSHVYVLEEGRTLIDAGNMYGLMDELNEAGPPDRLERILLTHAHFDHVGGLEEIYGIASPDLCIHPAAREHLRFQRAPFPTFFDLLEKDGKIKFISDGESIAGLNLLRVLHTPGHTAGDLSFFHEPSGSLFCGDTVLPEASLPDFFYEPDLSCGGSMQDRVKTMRKLLSLPVRHLFPGHGKPVLNKGADRIKLTLLSAHRSLHEGHPERAWTAMAGDLYEAGLVEEARQCIAKASQSAPGRFLELEELKERIRKSALPGAAGLAFQRQGERADPMPGERAGEGGK